LSKHSHYHLVPGRPELHVNSGQTFEINGQYRMICRRQ
jgi:hypothetical protein